SPAAKVGLPGFAFRGWLVKGDGFSVFLFLSFSSNYAVLTESAACFDRGLPVAYEISQSRHFVPLRGTSFRSVRNDGMCDQDVLPSISAISSAARNLTWYPRFD